MVFPRYLALALAAIFLTGCRPGAPDQSAATHQEAPADSGAPRTARQQAELAKDSLMKQLSGRLLSALSNGGPTVAIEVCSAEAPRIASAVAAEQGVAMGRTSWKLRNANNKPPAWAQPMVDARKAETAYVDLPDGRLGALFPIRLSVQCLQCHGPADRIAADVRTQLATVYPDDQATGFAEGDLRGWVWVEVPAAVTR